MQTVEELLLLWWKDQWGGAPVDALMKSRADKGVPEIDATEVAMMRAAEDLHNGVRHSAPAICEQIGQNLRANAINVRSADLSKELEACAETADQCALSIRHGRPITGADKSIQPRTAV